MQIIIYYAILLIIIVINNTFKNNLFRFTTLITWNYLNYKYNEYINNVLS